jgi:hypothetical protein
MSSAMLAGADSESRRQLSINRLRLALKWLFRHEEDIPISSVHR